MRIRSRWQKTAAITLAVGLFATACSSDDPASDDSSDDMSEAMSDAMSEDAEPAAPVDGPAITVASFNFGESVVLAEIYAQLLEANGYSVERNLNLGARELVYPEFEAGSIDLLPEYLGSALSVGFGGSATADVAATATALSAEVAAIGGQLLEPAPGEDKNVFVVTQEFADANGLTSISDLATLETVTFTGPPECEDRQTCFAGLVDVYGLDNLTFEVEQEGSTRVANLSSGTVDMTLLFSTQPVIAAEGFVVLEDDMGLIAAENIIPLVRAELLDTYGDDIAVLLDGASALITTDVLIDLNTRVEVDAENPDDVAGAFLTENGLI